MRFRPVKRFLGNTITEVIEWLTQQFNSAINELYIGLGNLSFTDNFENYIWEGTLAANEEKQISHSLGAVPSGYLIHKQVGNAVVDAGVSAWTNKVVYIRNNSGSDSVQLKVIFFR